MTLIEAGKKLNLSRQRVSELISAGALPSRMELTARGVARRLVRCEDVERLLRERQQVAEQRTGRRGRPISLPKPDDSTA